MILITGASGFIGRHLSETLLRSGHQVRVLLRRETDEHFFSVQPTETVRGDLRSRETIDKAVSGVDVVIHLAAVLGPSQIREKIFYDVNVRATADLLKTAQKSGVRQFIYGSTVGVLGDVAGVVADESAECSPESVYEKTKCEAEFIVREAQSQSFNITVIRPAWVYGPGDRRTFKLINAIASKKFMFVGKAGNLQHPVFISDLVTGIMLCVNNERAAGEIYHLGGPEIVTVRKLCTTAASILGVSLPRVSLPLFAAKILARFSEKIFDLAGKEAPVDRGKVDFFVKNRAYSIEKAKRELSYNPETFLEQGMTAAIKWYREQCWL